MASITIRRLDEATKGRLRVRAARHGRSMEAEARAILRAAVGAPREAEHLVTAIRRRVRATGGAKLAIPPRAPAPEPPEL